MQKLKYVYFTYIYDVCKENSGVICHLAMETRLQLKTCTGSKNNFQRMMAEFLKINCNRETLWMLLAKILETCSIDQKHETERLKHAHSGPTEDHCEWNTRLTKPQKSEANTRFNIPDSQSNDLTKCSIVQIICCIFGQKCILFINTLAIYTVFRKNTHSRFVLCIWGKRSNFYKNFTKCLGENKYPISIKVRYSSLPMTSCSHHIYMFVNYGFYHWKHTFDKMFVT